jgi:RNA polymerase sigma factor (sigma-70 family)
VVDESELRALVPAVIGVLVRRGADFASAEDAVQDALVKALGTWPDDPPRDQRAWLVTVAWRAFLDRVRSDDARRRREVVDHVATEAAAEDRPDPSGTDDTLRLFVLCAHPALSPDAAAALTLRAVGGLTTRQVAEAYLVPEATMAQRISRAKRRIADEPLGPLGDPATVLRVLYLVYNAGHTGEVDLATEAIRVTRQLRAVLDHPEVSGLLALMLLHHARRPARTDAAGRLVPLAEQDRTRWDAALVAEGQALVRACLRRDRPGPYQIQAAIAAVHSDGPTDWAQVLALYDQLVLFDPSPVVRLHRAVAVAAVAGPAAALAEVDELDLGTYHLWHAVRADLLRRLGRDPRPAYERAIELAGNEVERDHLRRRAEEVAGPAPQPGGDPGRLRG